METNNQIHFYEKFEFGDYMSLDEQIQRSMQVPFETNELTYQSTNNSLIDYPPSFFAQENFNNNGIIPQTFEHNNISCETDFLPWSECSLLYEECFSTPLPQICPATTTTTTNNNAVPCTIDMDPIPYYPTFFDQNELDNSNLLSSFLNDPNNHIDYFIDAPLNTVAVDEINVCSSQGNTLEGDDYNMVSKEVKHDNNNKSSKLNSIHYEDVRKYFDMPASRAAKKLNVSVSALRRRCRVLKIKRWPYKKIKSLKSLISNVKEMGMMEVVPTLEENKEKLLYFPGLELTEETKRLRQACFKANYKRKWFHSPYVLPSVVHHR